MIAARSATAPMVKPAERTAALVVRERELSISGFNLRVTDGPDRGAEVASDGAEVTVGAAPGCQLRLDDPAVSRHHLTITATPAGFLLRDLGSTNGTRLAGFRVREVLLEPGAVLSVGRSRLLFETDGRQIRQPLSNADRFGAALGDSAAMRRIFAILERVAPTDTTVLLLGETGTGKTLMAEALHAASARRDGPFVVVDCGAIPPALIESELFGHERGSFTGAVAQRAGQFEAAKGGTVFLDEVGELPLDLQPKLLRVLDRRVVRRVGASESIPVDVRVIAATNRDLRREVNHGAFRADLFYRLNIASMTVPPLRDRPEDIPLLVARFWSELAGPGAEPPASLISALTRQDWPGNVRQLRNAIERAVLLDDQSGGDPESVAPNLSSVARQTAASDAPAPDPAFDLTRSFREAKEDVVGAWERGYLTELLRSCRGNVSRASRTARMDRNHLSELLKRHGVTYTSEE